MTTRQLSSLSAAPGSMVRPDGGMVAGAGGVGAMTGMNINTQKLLEERILKLQEDLTAAYKLQSENSNNYMRVKEQAEKDEKALLKKEEESEAVHTDTCPFTRVSHASHPDGFLFLLVVVVACAVPFLFCLFRLAEQTRHVISLQHTLTVEKDGSRERTKHLEQTCELLRGEVQGSRNQIKALESKLATLAIENDTLMTTIIKLREEQSSEQNELNTIKQELQRANLETKYVIEQKKLLEEGRSIVPNEIDLSNMNSIIDHVAWTSNFNVVVPNDRKRTIRGHRGPVTCIRYNSAGTLFASAGTDGLVKIYDARSGGNRASLRATKESVMNLSFSHDDSMMLASGNDSISRIWSLKSSRVLHTLVGHSAKIWAGTFSADGANVVTGSHDRTVKIWLDTTTHNEVAEHSEIKRRRHRVSFDFDRMKNSSTIDLIHRSLSLFPSLSPVFRNVDDGACRKSILCQSSCNYLSLSRNDHILATAHLDTHVR